MPCKEPSPNTQKYKEIKAHLEQIESEILKQFPALSNDLDEYRETMWNMAAMESEEDFIRGFKLGAKFIIDILNKPE
jgi:hypothetical protein